MESLKFSISNDFALNIKNFILFTMITLFLVFLNNPRAYAAPSPATSTSALLAPENGLFLKNRGFSLKTAGSGWQLSGTDELLYSNPSSATGSLTVKTESLKAEMSVENYAKRWMKDYSNYGFDVLGTKVFGLNNNTGLVIDLDHKKTGQQLRQILFLKDRRVVILTCKDLKKNFESTLQGCNQITKTFEWSTTTPQKAF